MQSLAHFQSLASQYEAFFLDLWGVVHDGTHMYSGASECLKQLHNAGKKVVLISNAPRRAFRAVEVLDMLGVPREYYQHILTSGEAAFLNIQEGKYNPGKCYFYIGPERDAAVFDGLDMHAVADVKEADFLLNVGFGSEARDVYDEMHALEEGIRHQKPMLCLNPDMHVVKISGEVYECAGVIAKHYKDMGGRVDYFGKPHLSVYARAHQLIGGIDKSKILAVGDGLYTDIEGANRFGVDAMLIAGGILKGKLPDALPDLNKPKFIMPEWIW